MHRNPLLDNQWGDNGSLNSLVFWKVLFIFGITETVLKSKHI